MTLVFAVGSLAVVRAVAGSAPLDRVYSNYLLGCGGCHGIDGVSNARLVPQLRGQVGYFLNTRQGREYLVRLPNVAFYTASDEELAQILNYMVSAFGGEGLPAKFKAYTAAEVARLRKAPLNEVSLVEYRNALVDDLIAHHGAPESLRVYSSSESYSPASRQ